MAETTKDEEAVNLLERCERPLVFRGHLKHWKCAEWTLDEWASRITDLVLNFRVGPVAATGQPLYEVDGDHLKATMRQFLDWTLGKADDQSELENVDWSTHFAYSSYNYMSTMLQGYDEILESVDWSSFGFRDRRGEDSTFWLGSAGASTPCHQDTYGCNLVAQLIGRKTWTLFPPKESTCLYPTRIPYEESSIFSSVNLRDIDLSKYPDMESCQPYVVTLEPGDVLFVPKHWWHFVCCLDTALSINTWLPVKSDDESRLEEAVVRTLATALIPCYEPEGESWLNPSEEFVAPELNLAYIQKTLQNTQKSNDISSASKKLGDYDTSAAIIKDAIPVQQYTLREYAEKTGCTVRFKGEGQHKDLEPSKHATFTRNVIGCFLDPDVVSLVAKKLQRL